METPVRAYHVEFLRSELERRKAKNSRYSMRAFASFLEIHPSALSRILNGLQEISLQVALLVLKQLKMTDAEKRLFLASVAEEKRFSASQVLADAINLPIDQFLQVAAVGTPHLHKDQVLSVAPFYTFVIDTKRRFLFASESGANWLNFKPCEMIGRDLGDVRLTDGFAQPMVELFENALSSGVGGKREISNVSPADGSLQYYELTAAPIHSSAGDVTSIVFAVHDITIQKQAQSRCESSLVQEQALRRQAEATAMRARLLQEISISLSEANAQSEIAHHLISKLLTPFEAAGGVILMLNHDGRYLEPIVTHSPKTTLRTGRISLDYETPSVQVAKSNVPVWMTFVDTEKTGSRILHTSEPGVQWVMGLPLSVHGHVIGVLGLRFRNERVISDDEKSFLETVASLTAHTLDRVGFARETERNRALLDTVFHEAPVGIVFVDTNFRTVRANDEIARYAEKPLNAFVGHSIRDFPVGSFHRIEPILRDAISSGTPTKNHKIEVTATTPEKSDRFFSASVYPVRNGAGEILGAGAIIIEETEAICSQKHKDKRRALLLNAGRVLGSTLSSKTTLTQLAQLIVPAFAVGCRIDLADSNRTLYIAELESSDTELTPLLQDPDLGCPMCAWITGESLFTNTAAGESMICVPIKAEGQAIGTLTLVSSEENGNFTEDDVEIATELAERAALAMRNARRFEEVRSNESSRH